MEISLDAKERIKLENYKEKIQNLIAMFGIGSFFVLTIISFIPMGLLPSKRRVSISNPDASIFESLGITGSLIMILAISGCITLYFFYSYKFKALLEDLKDLKKIVLNVKVTNVIYKQGGGPQEIELFFSPAYKGKSSVEFIGETNFPQLRKNQEVELTITKNALYPLDIKAKGGIEDILNILNKYKK